MNDDQLVTIAIRLSTRQRLKAFGKMTDTYDSVINKLLDMAEGQVGSSQSKEGEWMKKSTKENIIYSIWLAVLIGILIYVVYLGINSLVSPHKTLYITSDHFPIDVQSPYYPMNDTTYIFYGTPQPNGTECISSAKIITYHFNYTTQSLSPTPQITNITDPKRVANLYYSLPINFMFTIPKRYTLLCPNIINATRWPWCLKSVAAIVASP